MENWIEFSICIGAFFQLLIRFGSWNLQLKKNWKLKKTREEIKEFIQAAWQSGFNPTFLLSGQTGRALTNCVLCVRKKKKFPRATPARPETDNIVGVSSYVSVMTTNSEIWKDDINLPILYCRLVSFTEQYKNVWTNIKLETD